MRNPFGWHYPAVAEHDPAAPWNQRDAEECPQCGRPGEIDDCDGIYESWYCNDCIYIWSYQIGPDPDDARDAMRDDALTGDR